MRTVALLGATGTVGQAVLSSLRKRSDVKIRCFVRSGKKLQKQFPDLHNDVNVQVFEGSIGDSDIFSLAECVASCDALISCVAPQGNIPGTSVALDTAHAVVAALSYIRESTNVSKPLPRVVVLSSATVNAHLCREMSPVAHWILRNGLRFIYDDLERAEKFYRLQQPWLTVTFVQPGGLVDDKQVGHVLSTDKQHTFLSFLDLGAAMVECGLKDRSDTELDWKGVSVIPKGQTRFNPMAPLNILYGWLWSAFPWLYFVCVWAKLL